MLSARHLTKLENQFVKKVEPLAAKVKFLSRVDRCQNSA